LQYSGALAHLGTFKSQTQIVQIKAWIAARAKAMRKICNAEMKDLSGTVMVHELIRCFLRWVEAPSWKAQSLILSVWQSWLAHRLEQ
jgi:hypothetical protein